MKLQIIQVNNSLHLSEFIRILRNSNEYKDMFISHKYISQSMQNDYMSKYGSDYYVCTNEKNYPLGFIGIVDGDLRLAVRIEYKHQGIGSYMLKYILKKYLNINVKIRKNNIVSQKFFDKHNIKYNLVD